MKKESEKRLFESCEETSSISSRKESSSRQTITIHQKKFISHREFSYVFLDHLSWDNFNESGDLKTQVEAYKNFTGYYPSSVHVDKIYRNRENRAWCKDRGMGRIAIVSGLYQ